MSWWYSFFSFLCLTVLMTGCGFTPIYEKKGEHQTSRLSGVQVTSIPGRQGQILTTALEDLLDPESLAGPTLYTLDTSVSVNYIPIIIETDGTVSRYRIDIIVPLYLRDAANGVIVFTSKVRRSVSYTVSDSDYTSYISSEDAMERGIQEAAYDVVQRVSAFLIKP